MPKDLNLVVTPQQAADKEKVKSIALQKLGVKSSEGVSILITRKSIDARRGAIKVNIGLKVFLKDEKLETDSPSFSYKQVKDKNNVIVVGSGPAGLFASLRLLEFGIKPIIVERGKDVSSRKRDIASLNRNDELNPDSNYAFGEGGAGTFSDGKLYTRSRKRGDINRILHILHNHGAQDEILYEAHPHIGTNILPRVISSIRKTIEEHGGEFHFDSRVEEILLNNGIASGVRLSGGEKLYGKAVILATGHSARDVYRMLHSQGIDIESKPFALGVRVEHPQELIDKIQYHGTSRGEFLPAASYSLVQQVDGRGVYSFCMCPGGFIVPASSASNEVVVNGMSPSARNSKWANSGIVVEIQQQDFEEYKKFGPLAGLEFQSDIEKLAYSIAKNGVISPAQRLTDFVNGKFSNSLPECSYHPGTISSRMDEWLPKGISQRLQKGFVEFDKKMRGFLTNEAQILGVESRTSSPVRIPRNFETLEHIKVAGLYPCGEGAGYAGGIVSSAVDGERCAEAVAAKLSINL
ncbi:MAG TPA: FAD-dependent monooxygenase [Tenuifilaceae bacterium]|nr:FAD-dependent monooxygenase [Tenuifilaceae bacterium]